jgi:UDP-glucose 4-epimerase
VLDAVGRAAGKAVPAQVAPRRPGDPAVLVADSSRAKAELGWKPRYPDIDAIVGSAWKWLSTHPRGYKT